MAATYQDVMPHLYADLLPSLRLITVYVTPALSSPDSPENGSTSDADSSASSPAIELILSDSRTDILVLYGSQSHVLHLPARVYPPASSIPSPSGSILRTVGSLQSHEGISIRLQVDDPSAVEILSDQAVPWSAKDLGPGTHVYCRTCSNGLFRPEHGRVVAWKDLPSADWAEMMDMWHCHKPDTHAEDRSDDDPTNHENEIYKGYGAANRVVCSPGTVFVEVSSFVFSESDCQGVTRRRQPSKTPKDAQSSLVIVSCEACGAIVGEEQSSLSGLRLYKSNVSLASQNPKPADAESGSHSDLETIPVGMIIAAQLHTLIDRTGARQFVAHCDDETYADGILIWVFNPNIRYSAVTAASAITSQRAMKVFYKPLSSAEVQGFVNPKTGTRASLTREEIAFPAGVYESLKHSLGNSEAILPPSGRAFNDWKVGLLDVHDEETPLNSQ